MAWTDDHDRLVDLIAELVPVGLLMDLWHKEIVLEVDLWRKLETGVDDAARRVSKRVVEAYAAQGEETALLNALGRRLLQDKLFLLRIAEFDHLGAGAASAHEAALAQRASTLDGDAMFQFCLAYRSRLCVIVADVGATRRLGTGFLVGPDLVLTAFHTLQHHISASVPIYPAPGPVFAIFDHVSGPKVPAVGDPKNARRIDFATDWLVESSAAYPDDGRIVDPTVEQLAGLRANLDFALVRLDRSIGSQTWALNGGQARGWFAANRDKIVFQPDQRIIIPQHPGGYPQQIDFGRFKTECPSATRIRYDTEAEKGTSGAPCFDEEFRLVGIHNAAFQVGAAGAIANQAVRIDEILGSFTRELRAPPAPKPVPIWGVGRIGERPEPVLGRRPLLSWIEAASQEPLTDHRAFAVEGTTPNSGRRFSVEILRSTLRQTGDQIIEFGTDRFAMPATALDLAQMLFDQLALPAAQRQLSPRPSSATLDESDKLPEWASRLLPMEINRALQTHRKGEFDARILARQRRDQALAAGFAPATADIAIADAPDLIPIVLERWRRIWFVVRTDSPLPAEINDLLAGLIKLGGSETSLIRWLFIGPPPDFLSLTWPEHIEKLDPTSLNDQDALDWAQGIAASYGAELSLEASGYVSEMAQILFERMLDRPPSERLPLLQADFSTLSKLVAATVHRVQAA